MLVYDNSPVEFMGFDSSADGKGGGGSVCVRGKGGDYGLGGDLRGLILLCLLLLMVSERVSEGDVSCHWSQDVMLCLCVCVCGYAAAEN